MIAFSVERKTSLAPEEICNDIFDVDNWSSFVGYGPIPGIARATMNAPERSIIGRKICVENTDGSKHVETIISYVPQECLVMRIAEFSPPLQNLATHFIERWNFSGSHPQYHIVRRFELYPKSKWMALPLWMISLILKVAVARHTDQLANQTNA
jgi:hypothetical protein